MAHVVELSGHLTYAERRVRDACQHLPGVLVLGAMVGTGSRLREIDAVLLSPTGLFTVEAKGTRQAGVVATHVNQPWTVDGQPAAFAGGANPLRQARQGAQMLRAALDAADVDSPFIPAIVAVSGDDVDLPPTALGDTWATSVPNLAATLLRQRSTTISSSSAAAILDAIGVDVPGEVLHAQGFPDSDGSPASSKTHKPAGQNSRDRRRTRRYEEMTSKAHTEWRRSHNRRLIGSVGAGAVLAGVVHLLTAASLVNGALLLAAAASWQLADRHRKSGPRDTGALSVAAWMLSLLPVFGIGAVLTTLTSVTTVEDAAQGPLALLLVLTALLLGCGILPGKSAFVHPPAVVLERFDTSGRPTGAFMLADAQPRRFAATHTGWRRAPKSDH